MKKSRSRKSRDRLPLNRGEAVRRTLGMAEFL
jgi:hypothetical protein